MLHFTKYHGLGNDFVVVDANEVMPKERAILICDRHRGIGADGVLSVLPARGHAAAYMHIYNPDGSVPQMCGNGIRCVVRHLVERRGVTAQEERGSAPRRAEREGAEQPVDITVETDAGPKRCRLFRGAELEVGVEMGPAKFGGEQLFKVDGAAFRAWRVDLGNPHAVVFGETSEALAHRVGPSIAEQVPGGVNVGFAAVKGTAENPAIDLVVYERGAGVTQACGTGACAAAVAAVKIDRLPAGQPIRVNLPGGALSVTVQPDLASVWMRGPAVRVFEGEADL